MNEIVIKQRIEVAKMKLELLKSQFTNTQIDICTILELASQIRDSIINDRDVMEFCKTKTEFALSRQSILDEIRKMQSDIITKYAKQYKNLGNFNGNIKDFNNAKQDLLTMIENEKALDLFAEVESTENSKSTHYSQTHEQTLRNVVNDCKNGRYKVLVMGDFQSGKSTTVDALCDGRHVCAIGKGVATSAVLVTVTYADEDYAKINWRTKKQLVGIFAKIKQYLPDYDFSAFDLDNKQNRESLLKVINNLRTSKDCPNMSDGDAKFLMLCDFILYYYGTEELSKKMKANQTVTDPAEITKFPDKGEALWKKQGVKGFNIDEVLFIFIERVDSFVQSETLRKLNCTVIDSPGLFNSSYDTMVTEQAMVEAHAIMYVLPYHKGINKDICMSLYKIKENYPDVHRKLFVVNNMRPGMIEVFESNCEKIKDLFGAGKELYPYDAKFAYLLQVKGLFDTGKASEKDYRHLLKVKKKSYVKPVEKTFNTFAEAWVNHIAEYRGLESYDSILQGNIVGGLQESGFTDMIDALRKFIENNEAYAIIVSNGLALMINEITSINKSLYRSYVEPYMSSLEETKKLWKNRIEKAEKFQSNISEIANKVLFDDDTSNSLFQRMAEEEYLKLFTSDFYSEISKAIAQVLYENKKKLVVTKSVFKKKEFNDRFIEISAPLIQKKIIELIDGKIHYLYDLFESEQDMTVKNMFAPVIANMENTLKRKWNCIYNDNNDIQMQDYINIPKSLKSQKVKGSQNTTYDIDSLADTKNAKTLFDGIVVEISAIVAGLSAMISGYVIAIMCDPSGISQLLLAVLLGIGGVILEGFAPNYIRNEFINKLSKKLLPEIKSIKIEGGFRETVKECIKKVFNHYISCLSLDIQKMKNERDIALHPTADKEKLCFRSVKAIQQLNEQLKVYDKYIQEHLTYETT